MGSKIDRHALHEYLWKKSDRLGRLEIVGSELGAALGTGKEQVSGMMRDFRKEGRLRVISRGNHGTPTYIVADPAPWRDQETR